MRVDNTLAAHNTYRQYAISVNKCGQAAEKLSSGSRINRAGDDAAGLAISEKMRAQIRGLQMASKNSQDAISLLQTAQGALNAISEILQRMRELAVQSASDTHDDLTDRAALNDEYTHLKNEIDSVAEGTAFNGMRLLDGSLSQSVAVGIDAAASTALSVAGVSSVTVTGGTAGTDYRFDVIDVNTGQVALSAVTGGQAYSDSLIWDAGAGAANTFLVCGAAVTVTAQPGTGVAASDIDAAHIVMDGGTVRHGALIQTGANRGDTLGISIGGVSAAALNLGASAVGAQPGASDAIEAIGSAIGAVSAQRAKAAALSNRLEHRISNLELSAENLQLSESVIRDADMAAQMSVYTQYSILAEMALAMLAQAGAASLEVLKLLKK